MSHSRILFWLAPPLSLRAVQQCTRMGGKTYTREDIKLLRRVLGPTRYSLYQLRKVIDHVGDCDLALTALLMHPRPKWLSELLRK